MAEFRSHLAVFFHLRACVPTFPPPATITVLQPVRAGHSSLRGVFYCLLSSSRFCFIIILLSPHYLLRLVLWMLGVCSRFKKSDFKSSVLNLFLLTLRILRILTLLLLELFLWNFYFRVVGASRKQLTSRGARKAVLSIEGLKKLHRYKPGR